MSVEVLTLELLGVEDGVARLRAREPLARDGARVVRYATRTGAVLRIDGMVCGAFDREHEAIVLPDGVGGAVELEVERRSLPTHGLPPGDGWRWRALLARASQEPARTLEVEAAPHGRMRARSTAVRAEVPSEDGLALVGHAHLDVAWLWTYAEARRKALRTFATAVRLLDAHPAFVFTQSQPQLYAFVEADEPAFFERVVALTRAGRFDASGAAMWVEPDANLPSGESLLRQLAFGIRYAQERLGVTPTVAWLPDTFGFANTLPTLLVHAGIHAFGTTKLGWNDTTTFPHAQFVWEGPDRSRVVAAQIASIEGGPSSARVRRARARRELLLVGYGDGGGGATDAMVRDAPNDGHWTSLGEWFAGVAARAHALPVVRDELYLEQHRGVATTHHDVKARNAALERALHVAELTGAWAVALRASPLFLDEFRAQLREAWEIVLRAQFHDVLPGTSISAVYDDVQADYDRAESLVGQATFNARTALPRAVPRRASEPAFVAPVSVGRGFVFDNGLVYARVRADGSLSELRAPGGRNVASVANRLLAYRDRPARWDAWNVDRSYAALRRPLRVRDGAAVDDGLEFGIRVGDSVGAMRLSVAANEPFVRVDIAIDWREPHTLLRVENVLALPDARARFGSPHGTVERVVRARTAAERAKFEAPGQRFARIDAPSGDGFALLALDTYGWSVRDRGRRVVLGHSLVRGSRWPDPLADVGEQVLAYTLLPLRSCATGDVERAWRQFAHLDGEVAMFYSDDPGVLVAATKPADDGEGIVLRIRECEGMARDAAVTCAIRVHRVACCDALERPVPGDVTLEAGVLHAPLEPFALRSFRVIPG